MDKKSLFTNLFIIAVLFGMVYGMTSIAPSVRTYIYTTIGVLPGTESTKRHMEVQWKQELQDMTNQAKNNAYNLKISDMITYLDRTKKIFEDVQAMSIYIQKEIEKITTKKES